MKMKILAIVLVLILHSEGLVDNLHDYCVPSESCWPSAASITIFKDEMLADSSAAVLVKGDVGWPGKFLTFNQVVAKEPGMVVYLGSVSQIRRAIKFAKTHNIKISIVSSGHSFPGRCGDEGAMQISVRNMKGIKVDTNCTEHALGCITTQAGVTWGEAYREATKFGRLVVGGSNPTVSVSGWTVGGGHSPLSRSFGLGVDNVLRFHLVTADLREVWTSANGTKEISEDGTVKESSDTSLFYALRGGGSAFGVIMDMTYKLHMDAKITQMACSYYAFLDGTAKTFDVMYKTLGELLPTLPNSFSGYILPTVGCDPRTKQCGGISVVSLMHYGPTTDPTVAEAIKKVTSLPHKWSELGVTAGKCSLHEYATFYEYELTVPNSTFTNQYMGGNLIQEHLLSGDTVDVITKHLAIAYERTKSDSTYSIVGTAIFVGGAVKDVPEDEVPVHPGWRNAIFSLSMATVWDPAVTNDTSLRIQGVKDMHNELDQFSYGKYYNEAEPDMTPSQWKKEYWGDKIYLKLMGIKRMWDPQNTFTCHQCLGSDWIPGGPVIGRR